MKNKYSIIIPVYNAEKYIYELWESIVKQDFNEGFECLFMDDASTDDSVKILKKLISEYEQGHDNGKISFKLISDGTNKKQGYRRNRGIEMATGELIIFLDSDDTLNIKTLQLCYERFKDNPKADAIAFNYIFMKEDSSGSMVYRNSGYERYPSQCNGRLLGEECEDLLAQHTYFTVNKAYKREFLLKNNIRYGEGYIYEDFEFYTHVAIAAETIEVLPQILYNVRLQNESTTKSNVDNSKHVDDSYLAIDRSLDFLKKSRTKFGKYNAIKYFVHRTLYYAVNRSNLTRKEITGHLNQLLLTIDGKVEDITYPAKYLSNLFYMFFKVQLFQYKKTDNMLSAYLMHVTNPALLKKLVLQHKTLKTKLKTRGYRYFKFKEYSFLSLEKIREVPEIESNPEVFLEEEYDDNMVLIHINRFSYHSKYYNYVKHLLLNKDKIEFFKGKEIKISFTPGSKYNLLEDPILSKYMLIEEGKESLVKRYKYIVADEHYQKNITGQQVILLNIECPLMKIGYDKQDYNPNSDVRNYNFVKETSVSDRMREYLITAHNSDYKRISPLNNYFVRYLKNNYSELRNQKRNELGINESKKIIVLNLAYTDFDIDLFYQEGLAEEFILVIRESKRNKHYVSFENTITLQSDKEFQDVIVAADAYVTDYSGEYYVAKECIDTSYILLKDRTEIGAKSGIYENILWEEKSNIITSELELLDVLGIKRS